MRLWHGSCISTGKTVQQVGDMYEHTKTLHSGKQEEEIMSILFNSALFGDMSSLEREKLLLYLVESYYQPRSGENCRARLKSIRTVTEM
jgi:hypothetical protein